MVVFVCPTAAGGRANVADPVPLRLISSVPEVGGSAPVGSGGWPREGGLAELDEEGDPGGEVVCGGLSFGLVGLVQADRPPNATPTAAVEMTARGNLMPSSPRSAANAKARRDCPSG